MRCAEWEWPYVKSLDAIGHSFIFIYVIFFFRKRKRKRESCKISKYVDGPFPNLKCRRPPFDFLGERLVTQKNE